MKIVIIGGGAAGFFTAINIARKKPGNEVIILEKSSHLMSKVKVSGGGRCNVTNARFKPSELVNFYPRGNKKLLPVFKQFTSTDMVSWLRERGIDTKTEPDLRMFPISDSSQTIIDCFLNEARQAGVTVLLRHGMEDLIQSGKHWVIKTKQDNINADVVILATGSSSAVWNILQKLEIAIVPPVPSLFTFNILNRSITSLPGISFDKVTVKIAGSKLKETGPLLITHWGLSGPAILKLSAWGAREIAGTGYKFDILINFVPDRSQEEIKSAILDYRNAHSKRKVINYPLFNLPKRFWQTIARDCGIDYDVTFADLSKKVTNKLIEELSQGLYEVHGKSNFKEEFVTSGGVDLREADLTTFRSNKYENLYFAGEVLDIDALTGGFNFQACWSAGWVISENI